MARDDETFPRDVYSREGDYTIREGAVYRVDDLRVRELAEIAFARRDLETAHNLIEACAKDDVEKVHPLLEQSLCISAVIMYAKPFGRNNARTVFKPRQLLKKVCSSESLDLHEYVKRCRDWMIAHDDGLGEDKSIGIYLPPTSPRSTFDIGLHFAGRRVVALGRDIASCLEPHFAQVRDLMKVHEDARRQQIAAEFLSSRFKGVKVHGFATEDRLDVGIDAVLALMASPAKLKETD